MTCGVVVVELKGFEPLTPCMPLMRGWFTPPRRTSRSHTTTLVRDAVEGWVVRRREVTCSAVSGKFLARAPAWSSWAQTPAPSSRQHVTTCDWAPPVHCSPQMNWVEGTAQGNETKASQAVLGHER